MPNKDILFYQKEYVQPNPEIIPAWGRRDSYLHKITYSVHDGVLFFSQRLLGHDFSLKELPPLKSLNTPRAKQNSHLDLKIDKYKSKYFSLWPGTPESNYLFSEQPISILAKYDSNNNVLWEKVYLLFDPFWDHILGDGNYWRHFNYFKPGEISIVDNEVFLYFEGYNRIFRLDDLGKVHTKEPILVMDKENYEQLLEIRAKNNNLHQCFYGAETTEPIGSYDYLGELLAKKMNFDITNAKVNSILERHPKIKTCVEEARKSSLRL